MTDYNPNPAGSDAGNNANHGADGNANQGSGNSQGEGMNQGATGAGNANQGGNQGNSQASIDYEQKFAASTTENQRLQQLFKDAGLDPKTGKPLAGGDGAAAAQFSDDGAGETYFTDEQLAQSFPSYATMSPQEQAVIKQVQSLPKMARMVAEMYDKQVFNEQLEVLKVNPEYKLVAEHEKEFREYAYKDGHLKTDLPILVDAFIGKKLREGAGANTQQPKPPKQQRDGMEDGSAGQGGKGDATRELTPDAARELRMKNPREYNKLAQAGKIKIVGNN